MELTAREATLRVANVTEMADIGELAKLGPKLGFDVAIQNFSDEIRVKFERYENDEPESGASEVTNLFILWCYVEGFSGSAGLARLRDELEERHMPMDSAIQDTTGIGAGPDHAGH